MYGDGLSLRLSFLLEKDGMSIATLPNRSSPPAILWRESSRQGGQVNTRTRPQRTAWPPAHLEASRLSAGAISWGRLTPPLRRLSAASRMARSPLAEGPCAAWASLGFIAATQRGHRAWVLAMSVARIRAPPAQRATARGRALTPRRRAWGCGPAGRSGSRGGPGQRQGWAAAPPPPERSGPRGSASR